MTSVPSEPDFRMLRERKQLEINAEIGKPDISSNAIKCETDAKYSYYCRLSKVLPDQIHAAK